MSIQRIVTIDDLRPDEIEYCIWDLLGSDEQADSPEELGQMLNIKSYRSLKQRCKKSQYDFRMVEITTRKR